jgi:hypothetical protein
VNHVYLIVFVVDVVLFAICYTIIALLLDQRYNLRSKLKSGREYLYCFALCFGITLHFLWL